MNIKRLTHTHVMHGILTVLHIPLLLLIYAIKPFLKVRFGYFSTDRIGHFALDLGYAIAINQNKNIVGKLIAYPLSHLLLKDKNGFPNLWRRCCSIT